ncbi:MAG TPA: AAA-like domain-containing protein [Verrucomicrobiae bacterium]|jgi:WD40 repeat protein
MAEHTDSSFYVTGGTLRHDAPSYVERQADRDLLEGLLKGEFCYVLTSRQMGKSSLMVRTANKLREQGVSVVVLDLTAIGQNLTPEQWYDGLLVRMGRQLNLEDELEVYWEAHRQVGPCQRLFSALRDLVLPNLSVVSGQSSVEDSKQRFTDNGQRTTGKLVLFVDELDVVRSLPFSTDEFFAAIRECFNRRTEDPVFNRLTFCLLGVATPSDLIRDARITPFNIGRRVVLNDFSVKEATPLTIGLQQAKPEIRNAPLLLERILHWTGGHPYLTQRMCQALAQALTEPRSETSIQAIHPTLPASAPVDGGDRKPRLRSRPTPEFVDELCEHLFLSNRARERDDNLLFVRERILRSEADRATLLHFYEQVLTGKRVADDETDPLVGVLRLSGIARVVAGRLFERNRIYEHVFDRTWVRANMPDAALRRERVAFHRGVLRATLIAAAIVLAMGVMVGITIRNSRRAERASAQAYVSQAEATRVSGLQGQRFEALAAIERAVPIYAHHAILRNLAIASLALPDLRPQHAWPGWPRGTTCATMSADFAVYARGDGLGHISVRDAANDSELAALHPADSTVHWLGFSRDGTLLAALHQRDSTHGLVVWNWQARKALLRLTNDISGRAVDFSPDGRRIAVGLRDGAIVIHAPDHDGSEAAPISTLAGPLPRPASRLQFHPSAPLLAVCSERGLNVQVWDLENGQITNSLYHSSQVLSLSWHPHGELLACGCKNGDLYLWQLGALQKPWKVLSGHEAEVAHVAFNHQGDLLASSGDDKSVRLWVPATGRQSILFHSMPSEEVEELCFSADDRRLGMYRVGTDLRTWEINPARACRALVDPAGVAEEVEGIDLSSDGQLLAAATARGILLWDTLTGRKLGLLPSANIRSVCFHPVSGDLLASSSDGVHRWPLTREGGSDQWRLRLGPAKRLDLPAGLGKMAVAMDGKSAAVLRQSVIHLFDPDGPGSKAKLIGNTNTLYDALALSADGRQVAARVYGTEEIHFWDATKPGRVPTSAPVRSGPHFCFSPDGKWFCASTGEDYTLLEVGAWTPGPPLARKRYRNQPGLMAFSPDGRLLAIAIAPSTIELVRLPQGESVATLESPDRRPLLALAFSRDGRRLAAAGREQLVLVWDLALVADELSALKLRGQLPAPPPLASSPHPVTLLIETSTSQSP